MTKVSLYSRYQTSEWDWRRSLQITGCFQHHPRLHSHSLWIRYKFPYNLICLPVADDL